VRVHSNGFHIPDEFVLLLAADGPFQNGTYRVVWRRDDDVGAKLVRVACDPITNPDHDFGATV
jgi:hypothetical protein